MIRASAILLALEGAAGLAPQVDVPGLGSVKGAYLTGDINPPTTSNPTNVSGFLGVPYAKAPVGDLRWKNPQPTGAWATPTIDASNFGYCCMQTWPTYLPANTSALSEDCLYLNIYSPSNAINAAKKLPVMFWIHGGAYDTGCSNMYPGPRLLWQANNEVVMVTTNYRLNVFGFLGTEDLRSRNPDHSVGNFGLQDQRASLQWVHDHIASFGGNPSDVTIFGESAGGSSVINHLTQTASFPLYKKAIIESGTYQAAVTIKASEAIYDIVKLGTGCKDIDCLVKVSAEKLTKAVALEEMWGPTVDGVALEDTPWNLIRKGKYNNAVPIMLGSNREETAFFEILSPLNLLFPPKMSMIELDALLTGLVGLGNVQAVKRLYDPSSYSYPKDLGKFNQNWWMATRIATDSVPGLGACGARNFSQNFVKGGSPDVFVYLFAHPTQEKVMGIPGVGPGSVVVPHASEISYALNGCNFLDGPSGQECQLAHKMSAYWSNFAKTGNPNGDGLPQWPKYTTETDTVNRLQIASEGDVQQQTGLRKEACDFWDLHPTAGPLADYIAHNHPGGPGKSPKILV